MWSIQYLLYLPYQVQLDKLNNEEKQINIPSSVTKTIFT